MNPLNAERYLCMRINAAYFQVNSSRVPYFLLAFSCVTLSSCETRRSSEVRSTRVDALERISPTEDQEIARAVRLTEAKIEKERRPDGVMRRDAHPKHHGCLKGSFTVQNDLPEAAKHGVFQEARTYPVWARVSNAGLVPNVVDDRNPDARGLAIKLLGVDGPKLKQGAESSKNMDFLMVNVPFFVADDMKEYNDQLENPAKVLTDRGGLLAKVFANRTADPLVETYFSISAFQLGDTAVKYRISPCQGERAERILFPGTNFLRDSMTKHLSERPACFNFEVQFFKNEIDTSVEKGTAVWEEKNAPFTPIAKLEFPKQTFDFEPRQGFCENITFDPWLVPEGQRPLGSLNRGRREVYKAIVAKRHSANKVTFNEPNGSEP
jgi:catalase